MKKFLRILALAAGVVMGGHATAGIPVIDVANLAQAIQQVASWGKQYAQMAEQITQLQQQYQQAVTTYNSLNGIRGMGSLVNNNELRKYLPSEWQQTMKLLSTTDSGTYTGLSGSINAIKAAAKITGIEDTGLSGTSAAGKAFQGSQNAAAMNRALGEEGYRQASERIDALQVLLDKVNAAPDDKDIQDLQARIQAEQAMLQNEQIKLSLMTQLQQAQRDIAYQQAREISMRSANGDIPRF